MIVVLLVGLHSLLALAQFRQQPTSFMPSRPVLSPRLCFTRHEVHGRIIRFISDQQTKCMYWECTAGRPVRRQCGLQTHISEFFEGDEYNPCTETYADPSLQFDCTRKGFDPEGNPVCLELYTERDICKNDGKVVSQGNLCWCECTAEFTGYDCATALTTSTEPTTTANIENAEIKETTEPVSISLRRVALRQRKKRLSLRRFQNRLNDEDNTGAILPPRPRPVINLVALDEGANVSPRALPVEFAEDDVSVRGENDRSDVITNDQDGEQTDLDLTTDSAIQPETEIATRPATPAAPAVPSDRVDEDGRFSLGDPCPNGFQRDFCADQNGCLNGGTCVNQCLDAVCLCKPPYVAGRRCEQFRCTVDVECMNGGTCMRGVSGISPVATCTCLPGFGGPMSVMEESQDVFPKSVVMSKVADNRPHHTFKDYRDSQKELPEKSPHQGAVESRMNEVIEGQRVKKKREKYVCCKCCVIL